MGDKLILDVECFSSNNDMVETRLVCSGETITCAFSLYTALLVFDLESISVEELVFRLFSASLSDSGKSSAIRGMEQGLYFRTSSTCDHMGMRRNVYIKYVFSTHAENSFNIGHMADVVTTLTVICTDPKYIKGVVDKLADLCVGYIYPYLSPKETFVYEFGLKFPKTFSVKTLEDGSIFPPSRDLFLPSDGHDKLIGCSVEICPIYNTTTQSKEIGAINLRLFVCSNSGKLPGFSDPIRASHGWVALKSRNQIVEELTGDVSVSVTLARKLEGISFFPGNSSSEFESEYAVLDTFCNLVKLLDPDIFMGYKFIPRIVALLEERCASLSIYEGINRLARQIPGNGYTNIIHGRIVYDIKTIFSETSKCMPIQFYNDMLFTMDSRQILKPLNLSVDALVGSEGYDFWKRIPSNVGYFCSRYALDNLIATMEDYVTCALGFVKLSKIIPLQFTMSSILGCPIECVIDKKTLKMAEWWIGGLIFASGKIIIPPRNHDNPSKCPIFMRMDKSPTVDEVSPMISKLERNYSRNCTCSDKSPPESYPGGIKEFDPTYLGFTESLFVEIDGKSMYPSMIIEHSIDISSRTPILVPLMSELLRKREEYAKKSVKPNDHHAIASLVLKLAANSIYGAFGSTFFRFSMISQVASAICEASRKFITKSKEYLCGIRVLGQENNALIKVVYVDTDGIILDLGPQQNLDIAAIRSWISNISVDLVSSYRHLEFKIEAFYYALNIQGKANLVMYKLTGSDMVVPREFGILSRSIVKGSFNNRTTCSAVRLALIPVLEFIFERRIELDRLDDSEFLKDLRELLLSCKNEFFSKRLEYFATWTVVGKNAHKDLPKLGSKRPHSTGSRDLWVGKKHKISSDTLVHSSAANQTKIQGSNSVNHATGTAQLLESILAIPYLEIPGETDMVGSVRCLDGVKRPVQVIETFDAIYEVDKKYYWDTVFKNSLHRMLSGNLKFIGESVDKTRVFGSW